MLQPIKLRDCDPGDRIAFKDWHNGSKFRKSYTVMGECVITRSWSEYTGKVNEDGTREMKRHTVKIPGVWLGYSVQDGVEPSESGYATRPKFKTKKMKQPLFDNDGNEVWVLKIIKIE